MTDGLQNNQFLPSVVFALDRSSERISHSVKNIYFRRSDQQRKMCDFYTVSLKNGQFAIVESTDGSENGDLPKESYSHEIYNRFIGQVKPIKEFLTSAAISIEDHNRLIDAGYILDRQIPINYYLIADAKDTHSGGVIIPLIFLLNDIIINHQNSKLHVLLNIAHFIETNSNDQIQIFTLLQEIKEAFTPGSDVHKKLCENLKISSTSLNNVSLYLFHNKKEATGEVVDNSLMEIMIGNALLSLMMDDIARKFARTTLEANIRGEDFVFNSIGGVVLAYDPDSLQKYCADQLALKTFDEILLVNGLAGVATSEANRIKALIGDFHTWTQALLKTLPTPISQIVFDPEAKTYAVVLKKIPLKNFVFLEFTELDWKNQIDDLEQEIYEKILPSCLNTIINNREDLVRDIDLSVQHFTEELPLFAHCYPGGIDTAKMALEFLRGLLLEEKPDIEDHNKKIARAIKKPQTKLNKIKQKFSQIAKGIPLLPKYFEKIPDRYQEISAAIYYHVIYLVPILRLRFLRSRVPKLLQEIVGIKVQIIAHQENLRLIDDLCSESGVIESCLQALKNLDDQIKATRNQFSKEIRFPLGQNENSWAPFFRIPVVTEDVAKHIYTSYKLSKSDRINDLIVNQKLFDQWMTDPFDLCGRLIKYHMDCFKDVWNKDLLDIYRIIKIEETDEENPLVPERIHQYLLTTQPLLRPIYETGDLEYALIECYYLMGDTDWVEFDISPLMPEKQHWEIVWTHDAYSLIFCQAWHNLVYGSIASNFIDAEKDYLKLSKKERSAYGIVSHRSFVSTISETDDAIEREYQWEFTPKGTSTTFTHYLRLEIDRGRYQESVIEERILDYKQWNHYAQTDMPELSNLAIEFQKIFLEHEWSIFNKAFCVLKFVQNAITYQKDGDSKGVPEWPRYPIETLAESVGDCEDVAILCAAILVRLGFDVVLLKYSDHPNPGHIAFGVGGTPDMQGDYVHDPETGKKYYFGEATADGWLLGEIPENYKQKIPEAIINVALLVNDDDQ